MNNRNTSCRAVCEENNNNNKKKCSNDNHRPTRGSASFWPRETEPRVLTRRTNISTAAGIFCFFLIFAERAQPAASRADIVTFPLANTSRKRIDTTTMPNER